MEKRGLPSYACWIDGEEKKGEVSYPLIDPSNEEAFALAASADTGTVNSALESAGRSFGLWRSTPVAERVDFLHALAERIRAEVDVLGALVCKEVGKPLHAARDEALNAASLIDYFAEESLRLEGRIPLLGQRREQVLVIREPVGVVVAVTPFNYPLSTLACKVGPALAAGCSVVAKPDEHTPLSTLMTARLATEAGIPPGVFNVVTGGPDTGRLLVNHPAPRLITFTGSTEVGKEIQAVSAKWVRKTILELGGHCPAIVCEDAPWRDVIPQLVSQSFKNSGQYCYRCSRIVVADSIFDEFLDAFRAEVEALRVGHPEDPDVDLGPMNNSSVLSRVRLQVETALRDGARIESRGGKTRVPERGYYHPPVVLTGLRPGSEVLREEIFGPVVIVDRFRDIRAVIKEVNATPFGLAAYLFTRDISSALDCVNMLEMGSVWINRIHQAYPQAPFGGMKQSGLGREKSRFGLEEYTELKTIYLSY